MNNDRTLSEMMQEEELPALEPCPVCGKQPERLEGNHIGYRWYCTGDDHNFEGPYPDFAGVKWNEMVRGMRGETKCGETAPRWQTETCGTCGWAHKWEHNGKEWFICRHVAWANQVTDEAYGTGEPACPAWQGKEG